MMRKFKMTRRDVHTMFSKVVYTDYCGAAHLSWFKNPIGYNYGTYGWNWDCYDLGGVAVVTGYRNLTGLDYCRKLNNWDWDAMMILRNPDLSQDEKKQKIDKLIDDFVTYVQEEGDKN